MFITKTSLARRTFLRGMGATVISVLEALGGPHERIRLATAARFDLADVADLNVIGLQIAASPGAKVLQLSAGLDDASFEHDGQLTKREVRAVTISALEPRQGELKRRQADCTPRACDIGDKIDLDRLFHG